MGVLIAPKTSKAKKWQCFFRFRANVNVSYEHYMYFNLLRNKETIEKGQTTIFASWSGFSMLNFLK